MKSYLGLLATGKNDFEAINTIDSEFYFMNAMGLNDIPSEATLRQRMDQQAKVFLPIVERASIDFLVQIKPELTPAFTGHCPLDADVTTMDNSGSQKEGVSRTYKGHDGYAPMAVYLLQEGYCLRLELREGKQHCQKDTPELLARALRDARRITNQPINIHGQTLLIPELELEGWWTRLDIDESDVIKLLADHGISEQFAANSKQTLILNSSPPVNLPPTHSCRQ